MTTKNSDQYVKIEVSSLLVQIYFNFENYFPVVHFTLDQTAVLFRSDLVIFRLSAHVLLARNRNYWLE